MRGVLVLAPMFVEDILSYGNGGLTVAAVDGCNKPKQQQQQQQQPVSFQKQHKEGISLLWQFPNIGDRNPQIETWGGGLLNGHLRQICAE